MSSAAERPAAASRGLPVVAIVGRPNAGKSTLFNRLVGGQRAVVDAAPGVTRDRNQAPAQWNGRRVLIVDTGGVDEELGDGDQLLTAVRKQTLRATADAAAIIMLLDGRAGFSPLDRALVRRVREFAAPVFFAVNKLDTPSLDDGAAEFFRLGVDRVYPISAAHGRGVDDLMTDVVAALPAQARMTTSDESEPIALAIVGRPNVGKSSLLNRLVGDERAIVSSIPGTTRDAVDSLATFKGRPYLLIDTAGIRRRPKVHEPIERASAARALRALDRAEIALVVLDGTVELAEQDARIAGYAWERGRALLLVVNKWDAIPRSQRDERKFHETLAWRYPTLADVPLVFVSALTGLGIDGIIPAVEKIAAAHRAQLPTPRVNQVLKEAVAAQAPPSVHGKRPVFYYATQTGSAPPALTIFTSAPELIHPAFERYLHNQFSGAFELRGTPLRLHFRSRPRDQQRPRPARAPAHKRTPRPRGPRRGR
ncbi:MAG TPA: ribosome biogenesis GTPase Der [Candidatus Kryptonia bacterium]|nr:ribosome biogenesis GTPase Der [Candidatus Kryptonia bacterium]